MPSYRGPRISSRLLEHKVSKLNAVKNQGRTLLLKMSYASCLGLLSVILTQFTLEMCVAA